MFRSWRRSPRASIDPATDESRRRSMPLPMQGYNDGTNFKNSSNPQSNEHVPTPEFSKVKSVGSVVSLRRLVASTPAPQSEAMSSQHGAGDQGVAGQQGSQQGSQGRQGSQQLKSRSQSDTDKFEESVKDGLKEGLPEDQKDQTSSTGELKRQDSWIWSLFKSERQTESQVLRQELEQPNGQPSEASEASEASAQPNEQPVASGNAWAFWARKSTPTSESGSLAISGTESEHDPRKAEIPVPNPKRRKQAVQSLVIPEFATVPQIPSRTARLASLLWSGASGSSHLYMKTAAKPKRAVVIGVHGYFPAKMTRRILGEPTGTSIKFANEAESRLLQWFSETHPYDEVRIDKIALEGEGKIGRRVERLYELLLNWEALLKQADFIFFAAHSQGAVVTINILARLLEKHVLSAKNQLITVLTMAGSLLGPMPGMDETYVMKAITRIEHDSLAELFGLQEVTSSLSQDLQQSLKSVLHAGVKVVLVGSADDQLIPLYSALAMHAHHPNLYRAVYLDGEDVKPEVIAPLLQLATQQLNLGHTDHGVIREVSSLLAGALTSKGHSKLYSHDKVYDLGLRIALQTSASVGVDPTYDMDFKVPKPSGANPYVLPWAAQALVRDCIDSKTLRPTVDNLLLQFHAWKPESKPLKDLKLRLGGMGRLSKL